ncbi:DUF4825 domain-containing protein [Pontibacillus marinus]|uniref:DUF4825 domain-containing protein n=1 Tax=Pontibacillus marinus BH030004 = DSM 16465 TaxID=1385511 RepID=A0A0A5G511_9BACI|nr:DUF4825 domain-containing protein [Pontibacillus marinus]KGX87129.1 hypothetical protein N783_10540 [Pontibacillus marinus BH030004 = DSM 16465]
MKKLISLFFFSLLVLLLLSGCDSNNVNNDIFKYKGSYIGDNNAVGDIVSHLPGGDLLQGFELKTDTRPYGMILIYQGIKGESFVKERAICNATFIFALIQNVEWITFKFEQQEYELTKENLQDWYGKDLSDFSSENELRELTQNYLGDESKVNQLFN